MASNSHQLHDLTSVDEEILSGNKMLQESYSTIQERLKRGYLDWAQVVLDLSDDSEEISTYLKVFEESMDETITELNKDINELRDKCCSRMEDTLKRLEEICKSLQLPMPSCGKNKLCLRQEYQQLKKQIQEYEQIYNARIAETNSLREKQLNLCKSLGLEPKVLKDNPLLSAAELEQFKEYLEDLEDERLKRHEKFCNTREDILRIIQQLHYKPVLQFEKEVISGDDFFVGDEKMKQLQQFHEQLNVELRNVKEEIAQSWIKLQELWDMLDIELLEQHKFREAHKGNSLEVLEDLRAELSKCHDLKIANIEKFVTSLRQQIKEMWQKCHLREEEAEAELNFFYTDHYSETVLELFELELKKLKDFYDENKEVIQLLNKHKKLWSKMVELQENANAGRLKNRGGQLLREERERNQLSKSIPKIEAQLQILCDKFEERHNRPFMTFGQTVAKYLGNLHDDWENMRKIKLSARKTPNAATSTLRGVTPLRSVTNSNIAGGLPTATPKRKLLPSATPVHSNKKTKVSPGGLKKQKNAVKKITVPVGKRSREFKNNMEKRRRSSMMKKQQRLQDIDDDGYVDFINEISEKPSARSTIVHNAGEPGVGNLAAATNATAAEPRRTPKSKNETNHHPTSSHTTPRGQARSPSKREFKLIF